MRLPHVSDSDAISVSDVAISCESPARMVLVFVLFTPRTSRANEFFMIMMRECESWVIDDRLQQRKAGQ